MTTGSWPEAEVDFSISGQSGTTYKSNIDGALRSGKRVANRFAPHELNQPVESFGFGDVSAGADTITINPNDLQDGMAVRLTNSESPVDPPGGLVHGTLYYVVGSGGGGVTSTTGTILKL